MGADFSGEVAAYYGRHRRGYPPEMLDALAAAYRLECCPGRAGPRHRARPGAWLQFGVVD
ncbi:hypothetical protein [Micromonospora palythoicola]|uniref:hypothetical protein n=1 Tax=Micromonospora palythoicola TaxID=3120507 RepID=UPI002FCE61D8